MIIKEPALDLILKTCRFEYNGCHSPDRANPLYGRAAYWRAYLPSGMFVCKITVAVDVLEPSPESLEALLKQELHSRIESIQSMVRIDEYGYVEIFESDPYRVKDLVYAIKGKEL